MRSAFRWLLFSPVVVAALTAVLAVPGPRERGPVSSGSPVMTRGLPFRTTLRPGKRWIRLDTN